MVTRWRCLLLIAFASFGGCSWFHDDWDDPYDSCECYRPIDTTPLDLSRTADAKQESPRQRPKQTGKGPG